MESIKTAEIVKQGMLGKQGGGAGGHKNWKDRYFVLSDHLYYYESQAAFAKEPKKPLGRVVLNAYFCSKLEETGGSHEFIINAYPKSLVLRAHSASEMEEWIAAIMAPLVELGKTPAELAAAAATSSGGVSSAGDAPAAAAAVAAQ